MMGDYFVWGGGLILMYNNERGILKGWSIVSEGGGLKLCNIIRVGDLREGILRGGIK